MDEITMRLMAKILGMEIMNFSADYKLADGQDKHSAVQALGACGNIAIAADGIWMSMLDKGYDPQGIIYYPGDYTMAELEATIDAPTPDTKSIPVFIAEAAIREAWAGRS